MDGKGGGMTSVLIQEHGTAKTSGVFFILPAAAAKKAVLASHHLFRLHHFAATLCVTDASRAKRQQQALAAHWLWYRTVLLEMPNVTDKDALC